MVYNCDKCNAPLSPGVRVCPRCRAKFGNPVPNDAKVPPPDFLFTTPAKPQMANHQSVQYQSLPQRPYQAQPMPQNAANKSDFSVWRVLRLLTLCLIVIIAFAELTARNRGNSALVAPTETPKVSSVANSNGNTPSAASQEQPSSDSIPKPISHSTSVPAAKRNVPVPKSAFEIQADAEYAEGHAQLVKRFSEGDRRQIAVELAEAEDRAQVDADAAYAPEDVNGETVYQEELTIGTSAKFCGSTI